MCSGTIGFGSFDTLAAPSHSAFCYLSCSRFHGVQNVADLKVKPVKEVEGWSSSLVCSQAQPGCPARNRTAVFLLYFLLTDCSQVFSIPRLCRLPQSQRRRGTFWGSAFFHKLPPGLVIRLLWKPVPPLVAISISSSERRKDLEPGYQAACSLQRWSSHYQAPDPAPSCPADRDETMSGAEICLKKLPLCLSIRDQASMNAAIMCALTTSHALGPVPNEPEGNGVIDLSGSRGSPSTAWGSSSLPVPLQECSMWSQGGCSLWHGCVCWVEPPAQLRGGAAVLYSAPSRRGACYHNFPTNVLTEGLQDTRARRPKHKATPKQLILLSSAETIQTNNIFLK